VSERATKKDFAALTRLIRRHEVGRSVSFATPFGRRLISYADLTATGRYLRFIDEWIRRASLFYANTHTAVSSTGSLLTDLREQSRRTIHRAVNAGDDDVVLFVGSGATAAANKLVGLLGLRISEPLERAYRLSERIPPEERPVVFVGPYEHHSNLLPWLESIAEVVEIGIDARGQIDLDDLQTRLDVFSARPLKIGSFSAASNVTGVLSDVRTLARALHRADALAVFDYAAAGPYVPIDMRPSNDEERIDALFLSPHKFIGGPDGSGVLVAHRELFRSATPERPGGGTVDYVAGPTRAAVDYVSHLTEREEGGTPAIMGDLRAGAAFLVKEMLDPAAILEHEVSIARRAVDRLSRHPRIKVLGPSEPDRLAIISLSIEDLHHDFASTLLDHLFGIQNRAGCSCAGPYGHLLLGIDREGSERFRRLVRRGLNGIKPGWVRVSLPYYATEEDVEFIFEAVEFVADHGLEFVPLYCLGWRDGVWRHTDGGQPPAPGLELSAAALEDVARNLGNAAPAVSIADDDLREERRRYLADARSTAKELRERWKTSPPQWNPVTGDAEIDALVWFRYVHSDRLETS
jgi:selenocysteine lyase/cysteine desulfurase